MGIAWDEEEAEPLRKGGGSREKDKQISHRFGPRHRRRRRPSQRRALVEARRSLKGVATSRSRTFAPGAPGKTRLRGIPLPVRLHVGSLIHRLALSPSLFLYLYFPPPVSFAPSLALSFSRPIFVSAGRFSVLLVVQGGWEENPGPFLRLSFVLLFSIYRYTFSRVSSTFP